MDTWLLEAIRCPNRAAARAGRRVFVSCLAIVSVINVVSAVEWWCERTANRGESLRMVINQADLLGAVAVAKESWNSQSEEVTCKGNDWLLAGQLVKRSRKCVLSSIVGISLSLYATLCMLVLPLARSMQISSDRLKLWSAEKGLRFGQPNFEHAGFTVMVGQQLVRTGDHPSQMVVRQGERPCWNLEFVRLDEVFAAMVAGTYKIHGLWFGRCDAARPFRRSQGAVPACTAKQQCEALIVKNVLITCDYIISLHLYVRCNRRFVLLPRFVGLGH